MSHQELFFLVSGISLYLLSFVLCIFLRRTGWSAILLSTGLTLQLASATVRWIEIGHPPVFGTYEAALAGSWFILIYVAISYFSIHGQYRVLNMTATPIAIFIIFYGLTFNTERIAITISERSLWVDFHALFSWLAFAPFTLAFCLYAVYLSANGTRGSKETCEDVNRDTGNILTSMSPDLEILDELSFRYINFGFINHTIMFVLGCYYSSILYGTWWQWDPAESTSVITWLSVALYIHMRLFYNWKGKKAAWLFVLIFFTAIFSYWGLVYLPEGSTFHVFDLELREH